MPEYRVSIDCNMSFTVEADDQKAAEAQALKVIEILENEANPTEKRQKLFWDDDAAKKEGVNKDDIDACFYVGNPQAKDSMVVEEG